MCDYYLDIKAIFFRLFIKCDIDLVRRKRVPPRNTFKVRLYTIELTIKLLK